MTVAAVNGHEADVAGDDLPTADELMDAFLHPQGSAPDDSADPSDESLDAQQDAGDDVAGDEEAGEAPKAGSVKFGKVKVDGEEIEVGELTQEQNLDLVRKGLTFDRRMSDVGKERAAISKERAELEQLRTELNSADSQALLSDLRAIKELRDSQPEAYHSLLAKAKGQNAEPSKSSTEQADAILDKLVEENASYPVVKLLVEQLKLTRSELRDVKQSVSRDLGDVKETTTSLKQQKEKEAQANAAAQQQRELDATRQHLLDAGVTLEQIKAKAGVFAKMYKPNLSFKELAEIVYANELATAKKPEATPEEATIETDIDPMKPGSTPKAAATTKGGKPAADRLDQMSLELFGRVHPNIK